MGGRLKIRSAVDGETGKDIPLIPAESMNPAEMRFDGGTGLLKALVPGLDEGFLRTWPIPAVAGTVVLRTYRLPETVAAGDDFEVDSKHHRFLLYFVKHLAYDVQDAETYDKAASEKYRARHDAYCLKAKGEQSRAQRPVGNVIYGGI